jgi:hypothetical protein
LSYKFAIIRGFHEMFKIRNGSIAARNEHFNCSLTALV